MTFHIQTHCSMSFRTHLPVFIFRPRFGHTSLT